MDENKEKEYQEKAQKLAEEISAQVKASLGIEDLQKELKRLNEEIVAKNQEAVMKVFVAEDTQKAVNELTKEEKIKAYARALFTADEVALKVLSEGTNADGGFTVPQDFYGVLLQEITEKALMRPLVTVVPMKTNTLTLSMIDHGPEVYWTAEGVAKTTTTADFSQPSITAYKMAAIIYLTDELIDDSAFDLVNVLISRFADRIATEEDKVITNGNGTTQPDGIFNDTNVSTRNCTAAGLTFDDIINLIYDLPVKFRANAKFLIHPNIVRELRLIKDADNRYMWQDPVSAGQPATLHGYQVIENYWCPINEIAFGDYKEAYWLGDRQRMTVKITNDSETTFVQDKTAIRVVERIGGDVVFPNAIRVLTNIP